MTRYEYVQQILEEAVGSEDIGAHGNFWRGLTREQFIARSVYGRPLVRVGDGANSNLIKALRGQAPFGVDQGTPGATYRRMPAGLPPVPDERIAFIERWIDEGCPDEEMEDPS